MLITFVPSGSHDSFSYGIERRSKFGPDRPRSIQYFLKAAGFVSRYVVHKWVITQDRTFAEQLNLGIRYFDLRVTSKPRCHECFFIHAQYGPPVTPCLKEMNSFLIEHPKEVILLDFNHFYQMTPVLHRHLLSVLTNVFGAKLCPPARMQDLTLNKMWENNRQVVAIYHDSIIDKYAQFWSFSSIKSFWANTTDPDEMVSFLDNAYHHPRNQDIFHCFQGVLTPRKKTIMSNLRGSLKNILVVKAAPVYVNWLRDKQAGSSGINICIMDFIEMEGYIPTVVGLNK